MSVSLEVERRWIISNPERFVAFLCDRYNNPTLLLHLSSWYLARKRGEWKIDGDEHRIRKITGDDNEYLYMIKSNFQSNNQGIKSQTEEIVKRTQEEDQEILIEAARDRIGDPLLIGFSYEKNRASWLLSNDIRIDLDCPSFIGWRCEIEAKSEHVVSLAKELGLGEDQVDRFSYYQNYLNYAKEHEWDDKYSWALQEDPQSIQSWEKLMG